MYTFLETIYSHLPGLDLCKSSDTLCGKSNGQLLNKRNKEMK